MKSTLRSVNLGATTGALALIPTTHKKEKGLDCVVVSKAYIGSAIEYSVKWNEQTLFLVATTGSEEFEIGDKAKVIITPPGIAPISN